MSNQQINVNQLVAQLNTLLHRYDHQWQGFAVGATETGAHTFQIWFYNEPDAIRALFKVEAGRIKLVAFRGYLGLKWLFPPILRYRHRRLTISEILAAFEQMMQPAPRKVIIPNLAPWLQLLKPRPSDRWVFKVLQVLLLFAEMGVALAQLEQLELGLDTWLGVAALLLGVFGLGRWMWGREQDSEVG